MHPLFGKGTCQVLDLDTGVQYNLGLWKGPAPTLLCNFTTLSEAVSYCVSLGEECCTHPSHRYSVCCATPILVGKRDVQMSAFGAA